MMCNFETAVHPELGFLLVKRKLSAFLFFHMAHLCDRVGHRKSMRLPRYPSTFLWVTDALLRQLKPRGETVIRHVKTSSLLLRPLQCTYHRICVALYVTNRSPLLRTQALNLGHDRLPCFHVISYRSRRINCSDALMQLKPQ